MNYQSTLFTPVIGLDWNWMNNQFVGNIFWAQQSPTAKYNQMVINYNHPSSAETENFKFSRFIELNEA